MESVIIEDAEDGIAVVTMNRPERLNALNRELIARLHSVLDDLEGRSSCRAIVLTGSGRGFCAGLDLQDAELTLDGSESQRQVHQLFTYQQHHVALMARLHRSRKPVIAAVNGPAAGGGLALAMASDIRVAGESARFGAAFMKLGASNCDMGISYFLPRIVGAARAAEILLTGRMVDAREAREIGLVIDVVPDDQVVERALRTARQITANGGFQVWMTKETFWRNLGATSYEAATDLENRTQIMLTQTGEFEANVAAFTQQGTVVRLGG